MTKKEFIEMVYDLLLDHVIFDVFLEVTSDSLPISLLLYAVEANTSVCIFKL